MHDSLTPTGGLVPMFNMHLGEVVFGGVGSGLYGMLIFVIIAIFIAGLMVGRTPEYLGKKIEAFDVKASVLGVLAPSLAILAFSAWLSSPHGDRPAPTTAARTGSAKFIRLYQRCREQRFGVRRAHRQQRVSFCNTNSARYRRRSAL